METPKEIARGLGARTAGAMSRALQAARPLLMTDGGVSLIPAMHAAANHADPRLASQVRFMLTGAFEDIARAVPAVTDALLAAFSDDPAYAQQLALQAAYALDPVAVDRVTRSAPRYLTCWLRGDAAGFAAALAAITDPADRRAVVEGIHRRTMHRAFIQYGPHPQLVADGLTAYGYDDDVEVRLVTFAILRDCATAGASLDGAKAVLDTGLADRRVFRTKESGPSSVPWSGSTVAWHAARALAAGARHAADPARFLDGLHAALGHRRAELRHAAAAGIGLAVVDRNDDRSLLEPLLAHRDPELVGYALNAVDAAFGAKTLGDGFAVWLADHGYEPAWSYESRTVATGLRVRTRDGLGWLVDAVGSARRMVALEALAWAARNGSVIDEAVPIMVGTLLCGDWSSPGALRCLLRAVEAGASATGIAPWLAPFTKPGGAIGGEAATDAAALLRLAEGAPRGVGVMRRVPFRDRTVPTWSPHAPIAPARSRSKDAAALAADHRLRLRFAPLWTDPDPGHRAALLTDLAMLTHDMVDLRFAQPAVAVAFFDPDVRVCRAAVEVTRARADEGADIRLAMPALAMIAEHPDPEVRALVRETVRIADGRHNQARAVFADLPS